MAVKTSPISTLNPNAPLFIPAAFLAAEDFSPEWWRLVQTCPAFRDFWLRERFECDDSQEVCDEDEFDAIDELLEFQMQIQLEDLENTEELAHAKQHNGMSREEEKDLVSAFDHLDVKGMKQANQIWHEPLKHHDKVANKVLYSPRKGSMHRIHQPRA